jgi:ligand-binding sensor domain-containing protein
MIFNFICSQKRALLRLILIIYCLLIFFFLFPEAGRSFEKPLAKNSKGENFPYILKSDNFSLNARNVKVLKSQGNFLWMGTSMGVIKYDTTSIEKYVIYDNRNILLSNGIFSISIDDNDKIWVGTYGGGLSFVEGDKWINLNTPQGLNDSFVYDVKFANSTVWIATWSGVNKVKGNPLNRKSWTSYTVKNTNGGLIDNWVYAIEIGEKNNIWFGTEGGLSLFNMGKWQHWNHKNGMGASYEIVKHDNQLATDSFKGSHHSEQVTSLPNTKNVNYRPNYIVSMHLDQSNRLWIGTWGGGLSMFNPETQVFRNYTVKNGLPGNYILEIKGGSDGNLWIGSNKGLSMFDGTSFLNYSLINGLVSSHVFSIEFVNDGFLWVGGHNGMNRLKIDTKSGNLSRQNFK